MRALLARMKLSHARGTITASEEEGAQSPLRTLKSIFPTTPLAKHTPLDILIAAPSKDPTRQRALIIRDMGAIENDWIAREFVLAYFEGAGISPPVSVLFPAHFRTHGFYTTTAEKVCSRSSWRFWKLDTKYT
jgi:hypothetical protein